MSAWFNAPCEFSNGVHSAYPEDRAQETNGYLGGDFRPLEVYSGEFEYFIRMAEKNGGPVLELASGAGRMLTVLAGAGFEVFGVEASEHMLALCRRAVARLSCGVQDRVYLVQGDMRQFAFRRKFPLIIIPYRSFWENFQTNSSCYSPGARSPGAYYQDAECCLASIISALAIDGTFVIDWPDMFCESAWWDGMAERHRFMYEIKRPYTYGHAEFEVLVGKKNPRQGC